MNGSVGKMEKPKKRKRKKNAKDVIIHATLIAACALPSVAERKTLHKKTDHTRASDRMDDANEVMLSSGKEKKQEAK